MRRRRLNKYDWQLIVIVGLFLLGVLVADAMHLTNHP